MKVLLMHRERDFDPTQEAQCDELTLVQDLELETLWRAMSGDDTFLADVVRKACLLGLNNDVDTILYRQAVLRDCIENPTAVRELYDLTVEIYNKRRKLFSLFSRFPSAILHSAIDVLRMEVEILRRLRDIARTQREKFHSEGFTRLFSMLIAELSDDYLARVNTHLKDLTFKEGMFLSAALDRTNRGQNYTVRKSTKKKSWWEQHISRRVTAYSFRLAERDEAGARALAEIEGRGINRVANALAQSADHIMVFFHGLRTELAFYVACLNLREKLTSIGKLSICLPIPAPVGEGLRRMHGVYDLCLALQIGHSVVANQIDVDGKSLVLVTGANRGGKSSFLRSIGLAQIMMQSGMFVAAEYFEAELCTGLFTHYKRKEDATMKSGKLDEELARMSAIIDRLKPNALVLFNESFASTNEREGSEIARQIVCALLDKHIKVYFVTHFYDFAHWLFKNKRDEGLFLRAQRLEDGSRTFKLIEGEPLGTSYGEDLYRKLFPAAL